MRLEDLVGRDKSTAVLADHSSLDGVFPQFSAALWTVEVCANEWTLLGVRILKFSHDQSLIDMMKSVTLRSSRYWA